MEGKEKSKALHVEINAIRNQWNFATLSNKYSGLETRFPGSRKMQLLPVKIKTKSDHSNKKLMKSFLCQKSFLEVIQSDNNANTLTLDTNIGGLDSLRTIISKLTSNKYLNLPLFLSVDNHSLFSQ